MMRIWRWIANELLKNGLDVIREQSIKEVYRSLIIEKIVMNVKASYQLEVASHTEENEEDGND